MDIDVEKIVRDNIDKTVHLSLATTSGERPWICEVHFAYDEDLNLYYRSLATRRHSEEIAENPKVAGNIIDNYPLNAEIVGLYFEGNCQMLIDTADQEVAARCLSLRLKTDDDMVAEAAQDDGHKLYKIAVENWYVFGRFGQDRGQKYKLSWDK